MQLKKYPANISNFLFIDNLVNCVKLSFNFTTELIFNQEEIF